MNYYYYRHPLSPMPLISDRSSKYCNYDTCTCILRTYYIILQYLYIYILVMVYHELRDWLLTIQIIFLFYRLNITHAFAPSPRFCRSLIVMRNVRLKLFIAIHTQSHIDIINNFIETRNIFRHLYFFATFQTFKRDCAIIVKLLPYDFSVYFYWFKNKYSSEDWRMNSTDIVKCLVRSTE